MKTRRQELRTNELIKELMQLREFVVRRWQWLALGAGAVVLVVGIVWYQAYSRSARRAEGLGMILSAYASEDAGAADRIDRFLQIADEYSDKEVVLAALYAVGRVADHELLNAPTAADAQARREKALAAAERAYERMIAEFGDRPSVVACGRLGLAAVAESRGLKEEARKQYKAIIDEPRFAGLTQYRSLAITRERTLDERMEPLEILPPLPKTQPATQPASGPAAPAATHPSETRPATRTADAPTRPVGSGG